MKNVLLFGGTGHLGREIAVELKRQEYKTTAVVRNQTKANDLKNSVDNCLIAKVTLK